MNQYIRHTTEATDPLERASNTVAVKRVLLLQGPVGPFFSDLHKALVAKGFSVRRVIFNAGDRFFSQGRKCIRFTGNLSDWEAWLRFEIAQNLPDTIILFGSSRLHHETARRVAEYFGIKILSLEEGYLRSGFISCEIGGNNQHSPLARWEPSQTSALAARKPSDVASGGSSFVRMSSWGALYYFVRDVASKASDADLFHRRRERVLPLVWSWSAHMLRRLACRITEFPARRALHYNPGYILIPLQVSSDSQLQAAGRGWTTAKLIDASLQALLASGSTLSVVFKLHPLERGSVAIKRLIRRKAHQHGVARRRIKILHSGRIGDLTQNSSGMVVINSTSAFSALHHGVPVLVLGEAIYRHQQVVTLGNSKTDVTAFLKLRHTMSHDVINEFLETLKAQSLLPGDFYMARGRARAIAGVIEKLENLHSASHLQDKANT